MTATRVVVSEHGRGRVPARAPPQVPLELVQALARAVTLRRVYWLVPLAPERVE